MCTLTAARSPRLASGATSPRPPTLGPTPPPIYRYVSLRIGPYVCGEYRWGGLPTWLKSSGAACFRCTDPVWQRHMARFVTAVVRLVEPQLLPNGGPVLLLQVENEYRGTDLEYLQWSVDMARNATTAVPWILCHDLVSCTKVNQAAAGGDRVICTINDLWIDTPTFMTQASPGWLARLRGGNPGQPAAWTEDQGWYDAWGDGQLTREVDEEIYGIARWLAYGGALHNFYMLTGGNNYGRMAGYTGMHVATAYAPDTPVDNLLLRSPKYPAFAAFFRAVGAIEKELLDAPIPAPVQFLATGQSPPEGPSPDPSFPVGAEYHEYGGVAFLSNYGCRWISGPWPARECGNSSSRDVVYKGRTYRLPNRTVVFVRTTTGEVLFNTSNPVPGGAPLLKGSHGPVEVARIQVPPEAIGVYQERPGTGLHVATSVSGPGEQLGLTEGVETDYLWYSTVVPAGAAKAAGATLAADVGAGTIIRAFAGTVDIPIVNGSIATTDSTPRPRTATSGNVTLYVLSSAMGLSNINPQPTDSKGMVGRVALSGVDITEQPWTMAWPLVGQANEIYTAAGADSVRWDRFTPMLATAPRAWFRYSLDLPVLPQHAAATQTAYALDLSGMGKGVAYVNGFNIGRYWLVRSGTLNTCDEGQCALAFPGPVCFFHKKGCGRPTQHLYQVPSHLLKPHGNLIALFEETSRSESSQRRPQDVALVVLHEHPHLNTPAA